MIENISAISLSGIAKSYGKEEKTLALSPFDLEINKGEAFGIIGPDGAGKSTILRILATLILPDEGKGEVLGFDLRRDYRKIRRTIGYMPQRFSLYPDLTVSENLHFFSEVFGLSKKAFRARLEELLAFNGLERFLDRRAGALSGGMKQKLALSCILIHTPSLVILDEPTTGVDPVSREEFWALLRSLREQGITLLVTTPYMDEAQQCDRICLLHEGKRLIEDTPAGVAASFPFALLEVRGQEVLAHLEVLQAMEDTISAVSFGDRIHLYTENAARLTKGIGKYCGENGLYWQVSVGVPTVEDVFVEQMRERKVQAHA